MAKMCGSGDILVYRSPPRSVYDYESLCFNGVDACLRALLTLPRATGMMACVHQRLKRLHPAGGAAQGSSPTSASSTWKQLGTVCAFDWGPRWLRRRS